MPLACDGDSAARLTCVQLRLPGPLRVDPMRSWIQRCTQWLRLINRCNRRNRRNRRRLRRRHGERSAGYAGWLGRPLYRRSGAAAGATDATGAAGGTAAEAVDRPADVGICPANTDRARASRAAPLAPARPQHGEKWQRSDLPFKCAQLDNGAVTAARSEFVLLLYDDTEVVSADWLEFLVGWTTQPGVGAKGARRGYADHTLGHPGMVLCIGDVARRAHRHLLQGQAGCCDRACKVQDFNVVTAACLMVRRARYQQLDGLDEAGPAVALTTATYFSSGSRRGCETCGRRRSNRCANESISRGSDREARHRARC